MQPEAIAFFTVLGRQYWPLEDAVRFVQVGRHPLADAILRDAFTTEPTWLQRQWTR